MSRISSRARQRAPRFHRPGSHGRRRRWIRMVFTVVLERRLLIMPRPRGVRASVARCRFVSRLGMTSVLRLGPARHAARVRLRSRTSFTFVGLPFPSVATRSPDVASLVSRLRSPWIDGHATPGLHAQSRRRAVMPGSQEEPVLWDMAAGTTTHGCGFEGSARCVRVRVASTLASRLVGISRRRMADLVDAVARVSCVGGLGGSSDGSGRTALAWRTLWLQRHIKISRRWIWLAPPVYRRDTLRATLGRMARRAWTATRTKARKKVSALVKTLRRAAFERELSNDSVSAFFAADGSSSTSDGARGAASPRSTTGHECVSSRFASGLRETWWGIAYSGGSALVGDYYGSGSGLVGDCVRMRVWTWWGIFRDFFLWGMGVHVHLGARTRRDPRTSALGALPLRSSRDDVRSDEPSWLGRAPPPIIGVLFFFPSRSLGAP